MFVKVGEYLVNSENVNVIGKIKTTDKWKNEAKPNFTIHMQFNSKLNVEFDTIEEARDAWAKLGEKLTSLQ
tara:strand:+ start:265 stop:477 length:213 start_codon:yes stop_codon:yes gene_type:complete